MTDLPDTIEYDPGRGARGDVPTRPALLAGGDQFAVVTPLTMGGLDGGAVCRRAVACYNACRGVTNPAAVPAALDALLGLVADSPYAATADACGCGEWGTGWTGYGRTGEPCVHIVAKRALAALDAAATATEDRDGRPPAGPDRVR